MINMMNTNNLVKKFDSLSEEDQDFVLDLTDKIGLNEYFTLASIQGDLLSIIAYVLICVCSMVISPWFWTLLIPVFGIATVRMVKLVKCAIKYVRTASKEDLDRLKLITNKLK